MAATLVLALAVGLDTVAHRADRQPFTDVVIGLSGMLEGYIGADTFTVIALVTLTTMLVTPFLATVLYLLPY